MSCATAGDDEEEDDEEEEAEDERLAGLEEDSALAEAVEEDEVLAAAGVFLGVSGADVRTEVQAATSSPIARAAPQADFMPKPRLQNRCFRSMPARGSPA